MRSSPATVLLAALFVAACGGSSGSTTPKNTTVHLIHATVDGVTWNAEVATGGYLNGAFVLEGSKGSGATILQISGINIPAAGTYSLVNPNPQSASAAFTNSDGTYTTNNTGGSGQLVITIAQLGHIKGSFDFVATINTGGLNFTPTHIVGTFEVTTP